MCHCEYYLYRCQKYKNFVSVICRFIKYDKRIEVPSNTVLILGVKVVKDYICFAKS